MIVQICSKALRNAAGELSSARSSLLPPPRILRTRARATFRPHHPSQREYSRTVQVEATTVETPQTSPTATASSTSESALGDGKDLPEIKTVPITYVESDGREKTVPAVIGKHLLDVAHDNKVDLEGACGGELSCSTCHLVFEPHIYDTLPPKTDEEQDMLDLAYAVTETSRLGCQVRVTEALAGMKVQIPDDGF